MIEEKEYTELLQVVVYIDPLLEKWTNQYAGVRASQFHEEMRNSLVAHLTSMLSVVKPQYEHVC